MPERNALELVSEKARRSIVRLNKIRSKFDLTIDEALILAAVAECNFSRRSQVTGISAASAMSVAEFLEVPYETARRRLIRLCDRALLVRVSHDGYMIADLSRIREIVDLLGGDPAPAEERSTGDAGMSLLGEGAIKAS